MKLLSISLLLSVCAFAQQGVDWVSQVGNKPFADTRFYNFRARAPGGTLTGGVAATVTFSSGPPLGMAGSDTNHYIYLSGGTGTAEATLITGGTCTLNQSTSCTITFTPANSHSGAWTISSATAGMQEAVVSLGTTGGTIMIPAGVTNVNQLTFIGQHVCIKGMGTDATFINNLSTTSGVFTFQLVPISTPTGGSCLKDLTISAGGTTSTSITGSNSTAVLLNGNGATGVAMDIGNVIIKNHNISLDSEGTAEVFLHEFTFLYQNTYGIKHNGTGLFVSNGNISNSGASGLPANPAGVGIIWVLGGGFYAHNIDITAMPNGVLIQPIVNGAIFGGFFDSVLADTSNSFGWVLDSTNGAISNISLVNCWGAFTGCYSPGTLSGNITNSQSTVTVVPSTSQPFPVGANHLTIDSEQLACTSYSAPTYSGCSRGQFGTTAATHNSGAVVFDCNFTGDGFTTKGVFGIDGITVANGQFGANGGNGINLQLGTNIQITGNLISQNSSYQTLLGNEIVIQAGVSKWSVTGNTIGYFATNQFPLPAFGVNVVPGASDNYKITDNRFTGLGTGNISDSGTGIHKVVTLNQGIDDAVPITIASSATISLGITDQPNIYITGTTAISTINGGWIGRTVNLIFTNAVPAGVATGGNIARTQAAAQNQKINLTFDGTNWY